VLLSHFDVHTPTTSYHDHNERTKAPQLVARLAAGEDIALVTDAGTPGISDPGFYLVRACLEAGVSVQALPGATASVPAIVASGLPSDRFVFEGFLPQKKGRKARLQELSGEHRTLVLYESPHRLVRALAELSEAFGPERRAVVARELSKKFEEVRRGSLAELHAHFAAQPKVRGELVLVIAARD
jgi:16S rRNA (cytidine1402-2'-O)-methyltransferase